MMNIRALKQLSLPLLLVGIIIGVFLFGNFIDIRTKQTLLSISLLIKSIILLIMPLFIIIFITNALIEIRKNIIKYFTIMILFITVSNFIAVVFGWGFFNLVSHSKHSQLITHNSLNELQPLFEVSNFSIINNSIALLIGLLLGLVMSYKPYTPLIMAISKFQTIATSILKTVVVPMLPLLILGFVIKIHHEGMISSSFADYYNILLLFFTGQALYVLILLMIISKFKIKMVVKNFFNIVPAMITGFTTFSSIATMPVTLECAKKILSNKENAKSFIPTSVNIHLIGTAIGMNIIILYCLQLHSINIDFYTFIHFAFYYVITMFAAIGVPGGSIFIKIPLIEHYLGASSDVIAMITTLVLLFDPIDTSFNVTSNVLLARIFEKINNFFK